ncbi:MAG: DUF3164 family protein [Leptospirales bacterium]|nr:DUF3164 family protein [Leptospirales bacterium]
MNQTTQIPDGYMLDAQGRLIPDTQIKKIDLERDKLVKEIVAEAMEKAEEISKFKDKTMKQIELFIARSAKEFKVKMGGKKGNVQLLSFDGKYKVIRSINEFLSFDERLQVAKSLIDECIREWSNGSDDKIKVLVTDAFRVDKQGKIDRNRILGLRRLNIKHPKWSKAMDAITESITVTNTKEYIRVFERQPNGEYRPIILDIANA